MTNKNLIKENLYKVPLNSLNLKILRSTFSIISIGKPLFLKITEDLCVYNKRSVMEDGTRPSQELQRILNGVHIHVVLVRYKKKIYIFFVWIHNRYPRTIQRDQPETEDLSSSVGRTEGSSTLMSTHGDTDRVYERYREKSDITLEKKLNLHRSCFNIWGTLVLKTRTDISCNKDLVLSVIQS